MGEPRIAEIRALLRFQNISSFTVPMEQELYDEFGNYIGPEVQESEEEVVSVGHFGVEVSNWVAKRGGAKLGYG